MRRTKKTKKTRMQGHMAVAISMAMAAGLALTGCGSTGTTGVSAETSAGGKNEAGRNTAGNTAGGQEESQSGAGAAQVQTRKRAERMAEPASFSRREAIRVHIMDLAACLQER